MYYRVGELARDSRVRMEEFKFFHPHKRVEKLDSRSVPTPRQPYRVSAEATQFLGGKLNCFVSIRLARAPYLGAGSISARRR